MEIWIFLWLLAISLDSVYSAYGVIYGENNPTAPNRYGKNKATNEDLSMDPWTALASAVHSMINKRLCDKSIPGAKCDQKGRCICSGVESGFYRRPERFLALNETAPGVQRRTMEKYSKSPGGRTNYAVRFPISGIPPESICSSDSDCAGYPLSYCDGVCKCVRGSLNAGSTCISATMHTERTCPPGQTFVSETGACMTTQLPGEPCQYSQQCGAAEPGAFCLRLRCHCTYGMRENNGGCSFIDAECNERGLVFVPEIGECRSVLRPGSPGCSHNLQCSQAFPEARCIQQTCTCPDNLPVAVEGTCAQRCSPGEVYSSIAGRCIPVVTPAGLCLYTSQCQAIEHGMTCERNSCRCPNGLVLSGSQCTQSCPIGYVVDSRGICTRGCQGNQIEVGGECLNQAIAGQPCRVHAQCIGGSSCLRGRCVCPQAMVSNGSVCVYGTASNPFAK